MAFILEKWFAFREFYDWALTFADRRVEDWFLMKAFTPTLVISGIYLLFVWIGPKLMENREPFKLKWPIVIYNFMNVGLNVYIVTSLLYYTTKAGYSYICQPINYSDDTNELNIAKAIWWYYFAKLIDLMDTVFFVLRKKNNQITFLHVYHHCTMFPAAWVAVKWFAGGQCFFAGLINGFIHVIMYTYYGIAAMGPQYQKYLWWKRYLTIMQLIQFFMGALHGLPPIFMDCGLPPGVMIFSECYGASLIALFTNFYIQSYLKKKSNKGEETKNGQVMNGTTLNAPVPKTTTEHKKLK